MRVADCAACRVFAGMLAAALALTACADDKPVSVCAAEHRLARGEPCDIRERDCQEQVFGAVRCVRGAGGELPELRVIDEETFEAEAEAAYEMSVADGGVDAEPEPDQWSQALSLLALLPEDTNSSAATTQSFVSDASAYYSPYFRDVTIVDRGWPLDDAWAVALLAHELTHALQDSVDGSNELRERASTDDDPRLALEALVEGEATLMEDLAYAALFNLEPEELYPAEYYETDLSWDGDRALRSEAPYADVRWMTYGLGAHYAWKLWKEEGAAGVSALWDDPPLTTVRWMAGPYAEPEDTEEWEEPFECAAIAAPDGLEWRYRDALGALLLHVVLALHDGDPLRESAEAWQLALGWRGDRFYVYGDDADGLALAWQIRMRDAHAVEAVAEALDRVSAPHELVVHGSELLLLASPDAELLEPWREAWSCRPSREDGASSRL